MKSEIIKPKPHHDVVVVVISILLMLVAGTCAIALVLFSPTPHYSPAPAHAEVPGDAAEPDAQDEASRPPNFLYDLHPERRTLINGKLVIEGRCATMIFDPDAPQRTQLQVAFTYSHAKECE